MNIRLPNITGKTQQEQLAQIRSYLYQFSSELQWAFDTLEKGTGSVAVSRAETATPTVLSPEQKAEADFNEIKALIIKSADIVNAYYETIEKKLNSEYTAVSPEFGTYWEKAQNQIEANSAAITQNYSLIQGIDGEMEDIRRTNAYIKTGHIDTDTDDDGNDIPVYGVEVGQTTTDKDGNDVFNKFARFTAEKLSFHDKSGTEIAWVSGYMLYITNAEILGNLKLGKFLLDTSNGLAFKWAGG